MSYPQRYKATDDIELKYYNGASPLFDILSGERDDFFDAAYACFVLGEVLWDSNRSPLSTAIARDLFRTSFEGIFDSFVQVGTFESYISVFEKIFGTDVDVQFTVPAPGKLEIDITATGVELTNFAARIIESEAYVLYDMITQDGVDEIVFQSIIGFTSQYELELMLFEMVPAGVWTTITLTLGA
jgi:hypothetical protein